VLSPFDEVDVDVVDELLPHAVSVVAAKVSVNNTDTAFFFISYPPMFLINFIIRI
jgi:hypothetical protein